MRLKPSCAAPAAVWCSWLQAMYSRSGAYTASFIWYPGFCPLSAIHRRVFKWFCYTKLIPTSVVILHTLFFFLLHHLCFFVWVGAYCLETSAQKIPFEEAFLCSQYTPHAFSKADCQIMHWLLNAQLSLRGKSLVFPPRSVWHSLVRTHTLWVF